MGGEPSGLSAKVWTGGNVALDAGLGYSYWRYGQALHVHGDVLWHSSSLLQSSQDGYLPLYIGLGARVVMANEPDYPDMRIGVRVPFGLEYVFASAPIGLFLEVVPTFDLSGVPPNHGFFGPQGSVGFRYYFSGSSAD